MENSITPFQITTGVWMVPCLIDKSSKRYRPVSRPFTALKIDEKLDTRKSWTKEEDEFLRKIIENNGPKHWSAIAVELNEHAHNYIPLRKGKQCRERWLGHLNPSILKKEWTGQEDTVLIIKQATLGNRWSEISKFLPGRTENQIKNRWRKLEKLGNKQPCRTDQNVFNEVPLEFMIKEVENPGQYSPLEFFTSSRYFMGFKQEERP